MDMPEPTDDYGHGQMMGMLVIIQLIEEAHAAGTTVRPETFDKIKRIAVSDLAEFLDKPEEDVHLLIETQLKEM